jgi:transcriptional regulator with XRE-family HTH domain
MNFKCKIKELRMNRLQKTSQADVARAIGVDRTTYSKYETGDSEPDLENVRKLADFYDVTVDYLLGREDSSRIISHEKKQIELTEKELKEIKKKAEGIKAGMMASVGLAFDGKIEDEDTLQKVIAVLEESMIMAKKEAKEKYTPKKYRK